MTVMVGQILVGLFLLALVGAVIKRTVYARAYRCRYYNGYGREAAQNEAYRAGYRQGRAKAQYRGRYDYPRYF